MTRPKPGFLDKQIKLHRDGGQRWRNEEGTRLYEWDDLHSEIEVYDKRLPSRHLECGQRPQGERSKEGEED